jgi:Protein of unknown function (DUF3102)
MEPQSGLPIFNAPASLDEATKDIVSLGRNLAEHAYLIGRYLTWVKRKLGHGKFTQWVEAYLWFSIRTAQNMMTFAELCDAKGKLLEYAPRKSATVAHLAKKKTSDAFRHPLFKEYLKRPRWEWRAAHKRIKAKVAEEIGLAPNDQWRRFVGRDFERLGREAALAATPAATVLGPVDDKMSRRLSLGDRRGYRLGIARESLSTGIRGIRNGFPSRWNIPAKSLAPLAAGHRYHWVPREPARLALG